MDFDDGNFGGDEKAFDVDVKFAVGRKCTSFVLDVATEMFESSPSGEPYVKEALKRIRKYLNHLALSASLTEYAAVLLMNAPAGAVINGVRPLSKQQTQQMENVTAERVIEIDELLNAPDFQANFEKEYGKGSAQADIHDVIGLCRRYCADIQTSSTAHQRVIFYSRNYNPFGDDDDEILSKLGKQIGSIETSVHISATLLDLPLGQKPTRFWDTVDPSYKFRVNDVEPITEFLESSVRSHAKVPFWLGEGIKIAVGAFTLVRERVRPTATQINAETNEPVERHTYYTQHAGQLGGDGDEAAPSSHNAAVNGDGLDEDGDLGQQRHYFVKGQFAHRTTIGGREITLTAAEKEALTRIESPGIHLIGFKPMSCLKLSHRMGPSSYLYPLDDVVDGSKRLYKAMLDSCLRKNVFALVRMTPRSNMMPRLVALIPQQAYEHSENQFEAEKLSDYYEGFHAVILPTLQSKRSMQKELNNDARKRTDYSLNAEVAPEWKSFVSKLTADYTPEQYYNKVIQSHYSMVESLALKTDYDEAKTKMDEIQQCEAYFKNPASLDLVKDELEKFSRGIELDVGEAGQKRIRKRQDNIQQKAVNKTAPAAKRGRKK